MKKTYFAFVVGLFSLAGLVSSANAHDSVGFSISLGGPAYYAAPPVYLAPPSVYYDPPPVVYYRPAPVYYGPSAYYRFDDDDHGHHDNGFHRGWNKHTRYHDRDDD